MFSIPDRSLSFNLEPTFRCNLECPMCPRFSSEDPHLDMSMETFSQIRAAMRYAHTVDFTGWGEPLLLKQIYEMIRATKEMGCLATMTSNGTALSEKNAAALIAAALDRLVISVDGMSSETYDSIRVGASFDRITQNIRACAKQVRSTGSPLTLGVAFTLQESNAEDLGRILPWMESVGARVLHLKHLNVVSHATDWEKSFLKYVLPPYRSDGTARLATTEAAIQSVIEKGRDYGIQVMMHSERSLGPELLPRHCLATPLDSVYFSFEGRVSPCCHFGHHVSRFFNGRFYPPSSLVFGDIREQRFEEVWLSPGFSAFRRGFETGEFPEECHSCYLLYGK